MHLTLPHVASRYYILAVLLAALAILLWIGETGDALIIVAASLAVVVVFEIGAYFGWGP